MILLYILNIDLFLMIFYQQVDYKKYYNVENYPVYSMHMNVELSNESVDFPDNLEDYWL